jgi:hypothetical protein
MLFYYVNSFSVATMLVFIFVLQRLDVSAISHDHGPDITKAIRLSGLHSFLCVCHELDTTVQKGIASALFSPIFDQAAHINSSLRNCRNLYRRLRSEQVQLFVFLNVISSVSFLTVSLNILAREMAV